MEATGSGLVAVVGTLNLDLVVTLARRPAVGETVLGRSLTERPGGKGANQARAAAAVASTALVGATGTDAAGDRMVSDLVDVGVDVTYVRRVSGTSGHAVIEVDDDGDNSIIVISGANSELTPDDVGAALDALHPAVVITQLESPTEVTAATAKWCHDNGIRFVLNPSPTAPVDSSILSEADPLIVNQIEAAYYADLSDDAEPADLARKLLTISRSVIITRGGDDVVVAGSESLDILDVPQVDVVDTTGAGDVFAGTLVAHLADGATLLDAARAANRASADHVSASR
ncbi:ribokinase [Gordonia sp. w5E2]|uniref:Ribokinase n=1 Tax=Gordonia jacobaea TaxID=122202 RepID=A0ABR5IBX2_9ACTN|nr:ribokinase [Gordonia jacobaea]KNA91188.1 sugar kinase [Gordonia jacobaea]